MTKLVLGGLFLYVSVFAVLWFMRMSLIYPLDPSHVTPPAAGLPDFSEHRLRTADGNDLVIWTAPARSGAPTVLYFCGNAGNLANRAERFRRFQGWGYGLVAMAYRGSSGSTGSPNEADISADAILVRSRMPEMLGYSAIGPVVYYGESLGSAVAVKLAVSQPPDGLILEAPFTSVPDVAAAALPIFPARLVLDERWDTQTYIRDVTAPLLVIHGTADDVIPYAQGKEVFERAGSDQKTLETVVDGTHHNLWTVPVQKTIMAFLSRL